MSKIAKIRPEQITRAQKLLQDLPEKDKRKTREEAADLLEKDFRKALTKGYSPKEISIILKNEGIIIPAYLLKNFLPCKTEIPPSKTKLSEPRLKSPVAPNSFVTPDSEEL